MNPHRVDTGGDRPLAGIGSFSTKVALGTLIAVAVAAGALRLVGNPAATMKETARRAAASSPPIPAATPSFAGGARPASAVSALDADGAASAIARDIERRHAAGELSDAQRRFEACAGGDLRRVAWIDRQQHVLKLTRYREGGGTVDSWFDEEGRLREELFATTAAGHPWRRRVVLDERGRETVVETTQGLAPDEPLPAHTGDPVTAFFSGAGCVTSGR